MAKAKVDKNFTTLEELVDFQKHQQTKEIILDKPVLVSVKKETDWNGIGNWFIKGAATAVLGYTVHRAFNSIDGAIKSGCEVDANLKIGTQINTGFRIRPTS